MFARNGVTLLKEYMDYDLTEVPEWLIAHKLTLNRSKTEFMLLESRQRVSTFGGPPSFSISNHSVKQVVEFTKSLNLYIGKNLTSFRSKQIASGIGILRRSRSFVPFEA